MIEVDKKIKRFRDLLHQMESQELKKLDDLSHLDKPGIYFIYNINDNQLKYIGSTDRPLIDRLRELREYPKDHTFHLKHLREFLEKKLQKKLKGFIGNKLVTFNGHELLTKEEFVQALDNTRELISRNYVYRTLSFENNALSLKEAKSFEHFAISIYQPYWNDQIERFQTKEPAIDIFATLTVNNN